LRIFSCQCAKSKAAHVIVTARCSWFILHLIRARAHTHAVTDFNFLNVLLYEQDESVYVSEVGVGSSDTRAKIPDNFVGDAKFSDGPNCSRAHLQIHSIGLVNVSHLLLRQVRE
jgi:hypothetical protein